MSVEFCLVGLLIIFLGIIAIINSSNVKKGSCIIIDLIVFKFIFKK